MKDKFINFLKKAHAWEEFKHELYAQNKLGDLNNALTDVFEYIEHRDITKEVLANGSFFFWNKSRCKTDWEALSSEWARYVSDMDVGNIVEPVPHNMQVHVKFVERRRNGRFLWSCNGVMIEAKNILEAQTKYLRREDVEVY